MAQTFAYLSSICWYMQFVSCRLQIYLVTDCVLILRNTGLKWPEVFFSVTGRFGLVLIHSGNAVNNTVLI